MNTLITYFRLTKKCVLLASHSSCINTYASEREVVATTIALATLSSNTVGQLRLGDDSFTNQHNN